jgi:hypothetical protein
LKLVVDAELRAVARQIVEEGRLLEEWRAIESDDAFQTEQYVGGFDATEDAFCFSLMSAAGGEYWFQFSPSDAVEIAEGRLATLDARPAES